MAKNAGETWKRGSNGCQGHLPGVRRFLHPGSESSRIARAVGVAAYRPCRDGFAGWARRVPAVARRRESAVRGVATREARGLGSVGGTVRVVAGARLLDVADVQRRAADAPRARVAASAVTRMSVEAPVAPVAPVSPFAPVAPVGPRGPGGIVIGTHCPETHATRVLVEVTKNTAPSNPGTQGDGADDPGSTCVCSCSRGRRTSTDLYGERDGAFRKARRRGGSGVRARVTAIRLRVRFAIAASTSRVRRRVQTELQTAPSLPS